MPTDQPDQPVVDELAVQAPNSAGEIEDASKIPPAPAVHPDSTPVAEDTFQEPS